MTLPPDPLSTARRDGRPALDEREAKQMLARYGVRVPASAVVDLHDELPVALAGLTPPYAVKILSGAGIHKSDIGGVRLGVADMAGVGEAIAAIRAAARSHGIGAGRFLVEEMAAPGVEMVVGGLVDARFGPVIMVGLGGTAVELYADVAFRICPVDAFDAADMLAELRGIGLLRGFRGARPCDEAALVDTVLRIGGADGFLCRHQDEIRELDINPLIVAPSGAVAADARVVLASDEDTE